MPTKQEKKDMPETSFVYTSRENIDAWNTFEQSISSRQSSDLTALSDGSLYIIMGAALAFDMKQIFDQALANVSSDLTIDFETASTTRSKQVRSLLEATLKGAVLMQKNMAIKQILMYAKSRNLMLGIQKNVLQQQLNETLKSSNSSNTIDDQLIATYELLIELKVLFR